MQLFTHVALWCSVAGATVLGAVGLVSRAAVEPITTAPMLDAIDAIEAIAPPTALAAPDDPVKPELLRYAFVIDEPGATYVKLTGAVDGVKHGKPTLAHGEYEWAATADVAPADLPAHRALLGRTLAIDGTCTATVTGFAILARLTGDPAYAGLHDEAWHARSVFAHGTQQLVAKLSNTCAPKPDQRDRFARDAVLPAAVVGTEVPLDVTDQLAVEADLFASDVATAADARWDDPSWGEPDPKEKPWRAVVDVTTKAYTHATTGERWITIRAFYGGSCGMKTVDVVAIYRERAGKRTRVWSGTDEDVARLVDVDNDGTFELLAHSGFGDDRDALQTLANVTLDDVALPYFGCPC